MNDPSPTLEQDERFSQKLADFVNCALQVISSTEFLLKNGFVVI